MRFDTINYNLDVFYFNKDAPISDFEFPLLRLDSTLWELQQTLSQSPWRCCLIIDNLHAVISLITQGDFLRATKINDLSAPINSIFKHKKEFLKALSKVHALEIIRENSVEIVPLVSIDGITLEGVVVVNKNEVKKNKLPGYFHGLILAGGQGKRLLPLTLNTPKPLLSLGNTRIIDNIISNLSSLGANKIHVMAGKFLNEFTTYFNENKYDTITTYTEAEPLDTGGPFWLWVHENETNLREQIEKNENPFVMICNGDLIFDLNKNCISKFLQSTDCFAIFEKEITQASKFGVIKKCDNGNLLEIKEKPVITLGINTGIYLVKMSKQTLNYLSSKEPIKIGMPDLLMTLANEFNTPIKVFELNGNFIDLGTVEDYTQVNKIVREN